LVTKGLYKKQVLEEHSFLKNLKKSVMLSARKQKIINRAINYLNNADFVNEHENAFSSKKTTYFSLKKATLESIQKEKNNFTFFIVDDLKCNKNAQNGWEKLKNSDSFTVSIDFYNIGFLFIKKGQVKEGFCIRI
tara:strand:+ start:683 stop:1087 length:405 start_codon:yes stop_codon:yes gene_type:complete